MFLVLPDPGSGSGSRFGTGSFYHQAKVVRKTLNSLFCDFFMTFYSLKNDVNVPSKSNKQKNLVLKVSDENRRILIRIH
jgi:hypothetical protein